ncbi:formate dehydrogenase accessory sulfurtransferase FdhD [Aciditerrimonas ferrireducens]|uniref:formate dehydrogenase accessory sulfurtransferase FdhD n=1 Tax=Aciditerrimonas ferrireducens TaxID=667306 RepID=UPI002006769A|nr:formate dehydrogenase accessory sulfurtransferase FdhD [Aciditerrimonas ferrireducens]MCK4175951.1 formate dehydrogenase accessory sulfurtransferase FdhD [Aciditerrimonas ferrireducens]
MAERRADPGASAVVGGRPPKGRSVLVERLGPEGRGRGPDQLAVEAPLRVVLRAPDGTDQLGVTMRTPGHDVELVAGLLVAEGLVHERWELRRIGYACGQAGETAVVDLLCPVWGRLRPRSLAVSSACGVCGTKGDPVADLLADAPALPPAGTAVVGADWLLGLPDALGAHQQAFAATGAVHAAGLAPLGGELVAVREDVGRHNAVDKVVGWAFLEDRLPLGGHALVVSGRVSFEIVQKAWRAGVPVVAAVSGATTAAVDLATRAGMTIAGFVRQGQATLYCGADRVRVATSARSPLSSVRGSTPSVAAKRSTV